MIGKRNKANTCWTTTSREGRLAFHTDRATPASHGRERLQRAPCWFEPAPQWLLTDAIFFFWQPVPQQHGHSPPANFCRAQRRSSQQARMLCFADSCLFQPLHPNGARPAQHRCLEPSGQSTPSIGSGAGHAAVWINVVAWVVRSSKTRLTASIKAGRSGRLFFKGASSSRRPLYLWRTFSINSGVPPRQP